MAERRREGERVDSRYYKRLMMAAIRGYAVRHAEADFLDPRLTDCDLCELTGSECEEILGAARERGMKLHYFKRSDHMLPRVSRVLGFFKGISFDSILDVGSGRGAFLFPFLEQFPWVEVWSADILAGRVELLSDITGGGLERLHPMLADVCAQPLPDGSVDVVTMLEVLEHIPNVDVAVRAATRMARKFVVVSVPSREDNNPEHIHLLTRERLTMLFEACGVSRLSFDAVPGHLLMIANLGV